MAAVITFDNIRALAVGLSERDAAAVRKKFTAHADGFMHRAPYKYGDWDGRVTAIGADLSFDTGLLPSVLEVLSGEVRLVDQRPIRQLELAPTTVELRDYQMEAQRATFGNMLAGQLWWPRGIENTATGGGKTQNAVAKVQMARVPTLFIVDQTDLVVQTRERFARYGVESGTISEGRVHGTREFVVTTIQSLMAWSFAVNQRTSKGRRTDEEMTRLLARKAEAEAHIREFLLTIEQVIVDEAHMMGEDRDRPGQGNTLYQALALMPNAYMRWGLTGTPFMRDACSNWLMEGALGRELSQKSSKELIDEQYLAKPEIFFHTGPQMAIPNDPHTEYQLGVVLADWRNRKIVELLRDESGPTLVLVSTESHGRVLKVLCEQAGVEVEFVYGKTSLDEREQVWQGMRDGKILRTIACQIADKGIDIDSVRTLILAGGGKSRRLQIQRLGRGLRRTADKVNVRVHEFLDRATARLLRQARTRRRILTQEGHSVTDIAA